VLQTSGLSQRMSVFGRFLVYQILPNFTNFYQKCVAKGVRRGSKRQLMGGFLRPIYLNRVKSRGSCQAITGVAWFQNRRERHRGVRVPRIEPGGGHGSCLELFRAQPALARVAEKVDFGRRKGGALAPPPERAILFSIIYPEGVGAAGLKPRPSDARNRSRVRQARGTAGRSFRVWSGE